MPSWPSKRNLHPHCLQAVADSNLKKTPEKGAKPAAIFIFTCKGENQVQCLESGTKSKHNP
jgi:hypothetical protein